MPKLFTILLFSLLTFAASAQNYEIGVSAGAAGYVGDLNPRNPLQVSGPAFGGFVRRNFSPYLSARLGYTHGWIQAADSTSSYAQNRARNLSFVTTLDELSLVGEFNLFQYRPGEYGHTFTPFVYLGVGGVYYSPTAVYRGTRYDLRSGLLEGQDKPYSKVALAIPFGVGVKYNFGGNLSLAADAGFRTTNTDYLDDVSGNYADKSKFLSPVSLGLSDRTGEVNGGVNTGVAGTQRGDGRARDTYMFFTISVSYTFLSERCYFK